MIKEAQRQTRFFLCCIAVSMALPIAIASAAVVMRPRYIRTIFRHGGVEDESQAKNGKKFKFGLSRLSLARPSPQTASTQRLASNALDWGELGISRKGFHAGTSSDTSYHSQQSPFGDVLFTHDSRIESTNAHGALEWRLQFSGNTNCSPPSACKA
jgi:hypothetical protein